MSEWLLFAWGAAVTLLGLLAVVLILGKVEGDDEKKERNRILRGMRLLRSSIRRK